MNDTIRTNGVEVSGSMVDSMRSIRPWTKFLAILGFISTGLMVLVGAGAVVLARIFPPQKGAPPAFLGAFYILFSALYFMPAFYLYKYSASIGRFLAKSGVEDLETAFTYQRSFWKFVGIVAMIGLLLGVLSVAAAIVIPLLTRTGTQHGI